jgi:hypothetical protein
LIDEGSGEGRVGGDLFDGVEKEEDVGVVLCYVSYQGKGGKKIESNSVGLSNLSDFHTFPIPSSSSSSKTTLILVIAIVFGVLSLCVCGFIVLIVFWKWWRRRERRKRRGRLGEGRDGLGTRLVNEDDYLSVSKVLFYNTEETSNESVSVFHERRMSVEEIGGREEKKEEEKGETTTVTYTHTLLLSEDLPSLSSSSSTSSSLYGHPAS